MKPTLFISDLHLSEDAKHTTALFDHFCQTIAVHAAELYILGDLFDVWYGDDDATPFNDHIAAQLLQLSRLGVKLHIMHGNRDFLMTKRFCQRVGANLLKDPSFYQLDSQRVLLTHGDLLCTDDHQYLNVRRKVRHPITLALLKCLPLSARQAIGRHLREDSEHQKQQKTATIMDVNEQTVTEWFERHEVNSMIHGHTHRPNTHQHTTNQGTATRHVLGAWYETGSYIEAMNGHLTHHTFTD